MAIRAGTLACYHVVFCLKTGVRSVLAEQGDRSAASQAAPIHDIVDNSRHRFGGRQAVRPAYNAPGEHLSQFRFRDGCRIGNIAPPNLHNLHIKNPFCTGFQPCSKGRRGIALL